MERQHGRTFTVARIARQLRVDRHRVEYVIRTRGIPAEDRIGIARVFSHEAFDRIKSELARIAQTRAGGAA